MPNNLTLILKGLGASAGIAQGKAKIIKPDRQNINFLPGEILVTKITDPSMVWLMSQAAAIITDIGGINSHPAIVARELGIPCVVATKTATANLKDGQEIIVDGLKGEVYSTDNKVTDQDYNNLLEAYRQAWSKMDISLFKNTTDFKKLDPLIAEVWMEKVLTIIEQAENQNLSQREIGQLFHSPNALRSNGLFDLFMASYAKLPKATRLKIGDFYIKTLKTICLKDPFSLYGHNIIHRQTEIKKIVAAVKPASPEIAKKLGRIVNACYHLSYSLFGDMNPQLVYENYGPYYVINQKNEKKYLIVIKEFKNMRPVEFWPETSRLPFNNIKIVSLYENVKFSIDAITHTNYQGDLINGLKYFALYVNSRPAEISQAENIAIMLEKYADFIWFIFRRMDDKKYRLTYLYQKAYNYINLCEKLGLEWRPDKKIIEAMLNRPYKQWPDFKTPAEENEYFLKIINPRTDFSG